VCLALGFGDGRLRWRVGLRGRLVAAGRVARLLPVGFVARIARSGSGCRRPLLAGRLVRIGRIVIGLAAVRRLLPVPAAAGLLRRRLALHRRRDEPAVGDRIGHARLLRERFVVGLDGVFVATGARQRVAAVVVGIGTGQRLPRIRGGGVVSAAVGVGAFAHALVPDLVAATPERSVVGRQRLLPRQAGAQQQRGDTAAAPERKQPQQ